VVHQFKKQRINVNVVYISLWLLQED